MGRFLPINLRKKTNNGIHGFYEVYKDHNGNFNSNIRNCPSNISPYRKLFEEVYLLKGKEIEELDQCDIYHAANSMRKIFEEFLNFKKPNLLPQKSNQREIEDMYYHVTGKELSKNRKLELGALLSFINVLSHRSLKSDEIIENSKTLMKLIEDIDRVHFHEMKKSVVG